MVLSGRAEGFVMSDTITRSRAGAVLTLRFNRPEKLNAFNDEMSAALLAALDDAAADRSVRAQETANYAERFVALSPVALGLTKRAFNRAVLPHFAEWLDEEAQLQEEAARSPDLREGVLAFMQKRPAVF